MPDRAALVTGASSGIGLAIAEVLGEEGYGLTVAARRPEKLAGAAEELARQGLRGRGGRRQPGRRGGRSSASWPPTASATGGSTCSSTAPGVGVGAPVAEIQTKRVDMQLDLNLRAIVLFYRECAELLRARRRRAPQRARRQPRPRSPASRGAGLAVGLLGHQGRRHRLHAGDEQGARRRRDQVVALCPGFVDTPMTEFVKRAGRRRT